MTKKLLASVALAIAGLGFASAQTYVNETALVGTSKEAWHGSGTYSATVTPLGGTPVNVAEFYTESADGIAALVPGYTPLYQEISGLPDGTYKLELYATANQAWNKLGDTGLTGNSTTANAIFATVGETTLTAEMTSGAQTGYETPASYTIDNIAVTGGKMTVGIVLLEEKRCNWYTIQIKSLQKVADEAEALEQAQLDLAAAKQSATDFLAAYADASAAAKAPIEALINVNPTTLEAIQAATAALTGMDVSLKRAVVESNALAEGVEGAVKMTDKIVNPMAQSYDGWTTLKNDNPTFNLNSSESPILANGDRPKYFDHWSGDKWRASVTQAINLEAGKYRISALARGQVGMDHYCLVAIPGNLSDAEINSIRQNSTYPDGYYMNLPHEGSTGGIFDHGFNMAYFDFTLSTGGDVTIGVFADAEHYPGSWVSYTDFNLVQLEKIDPLAAALENLAAAKQAATEFLAANPDASEASIAAIQTLIDAANPTTVDEVNAAVEALNNPVLRRAVAQSNVLAQGKNATDMSDLIKNRIATEAAGLADWNVGLNPSDGTDFRVKTAQKPVLADGSELDYFDGWRNGNLAIRFTQDVTLAPGEYRLGVIARSSTDMGWCRLIALPDNTEPLLNYRDGQTAFPEGTAADIAKSGSEGNVFGNGYGITYLDFTLWDEATVTLGVMFNSLGKSGQWASWTDFTLVKLADVELTVDFPAVDGATASDKGLPECKIESNTDYTVSFDVPAPLKLYYRMDYFDADQGIPAVEKAPAREALEGYTEYTEPFTINGYGNLRYYVETPGGRQSDVQVYGLYSELTGVESVAVESNEAPVYYDLRGNRVVNPANGIFIRVQGGKAVKLAL